MNRKPAHQAAFHQHSIRAPLSKPLLKRCPEFTRGTVRRVLKRQFRYSAASDKSSSCVLCASTYVPAPTVSPERTCDSHLLLLASAAFSRCCAHLAREAVVDELHVAHCGLEVRRLVERLGDEAAAVCAVVRGGQHCTLPAEVCVCVSTSGELCLVAAGGAPRVGKPGWACGHTPASPVLYSPRREPGVVW